MMDEVVHNADGTFKKKALGYRKKNCTKCGQQLWLRDFYKFGRSKDHPDGYDCRCKACRRKEKREWYTRNRKKPDGLFRNARGQLVEHKGNSTKLTWGELRTQDFRRLFPVTKNEDLAIEFGCSPRTIVRKARQMGLKKDPQWLKGVWDKNRVLAIGFVKIHGPIFDREKLIEAGKPYRFRKKVNPLDWRNTEL